MFALANSFGLYMMTMGETRHDVSFTKDIAHALKFSKAEEAEGKLKRMRLMKLKVVDLQETQKQKH